MQAISPLHDQHDTPTGLLHTIIFNRALGLLSPKEVTSSLFDITYVRTHTLLHRSRLHTCTLQAHCGEASVDQQVEDKISAYLTWLERNPTKQGQLLLSFYETRRKQAWFAAQEERLYWEQWCVAIGGYYQRHLPSTSRP